MAATSAGTGKRAVGRRREVPQPLTHDAGMNNACALGKTQT